MVIKSQIVCKCNEQESAPIKTNMQSLSRARSGAIKPLKSAIECVPRECLCNSLLRWWFAKNTSPKRRKKRRGEIFNRSLCVIGYIYFVIRNFHELFIASCSWNRVDLEWARGFSNEKPHAEGLKLWTKWKVRISLELLHKFSGPHWLIRSFPKPL